MYDHVFISDTHLGSKFAKITLLETFLKGLSTHNLSLVGDIWDFWKADSNTDYSYLFQNFPAIHYFWGNHDLWLQNLAHIAPNIKEAGLIEHNETRFFIHHGHIFDPSFGESSLLNTWLDKLIYSISKALRWDIRTTFHFLTERYYHNVAEIVAIRMKTQHLKLPFDVLISGHTHCAGATQMDKFHVFNLGSWLQTPYAFFLKGDQYAFIKITTDKLYPEEKDFNNIGGLRSL